MGRRRSARQKAEQQASLKTLILTAVSCVVLGGGLALGLTGFLPEEPELAQVVGHAHSAADASFRQTMEGVLATRIESGNRIETLENGDEIFPAMLKAIAEARRTINFATYIYWSGDIAQTFADALSERARAGVRVNLMLDYVGSLEMDERLIEQMRSAGVHLIHFRPLHWYSVDRFNYRSHRKVLVTDGVIGFTGGVGIADKWKGDARNPNEWRDTHYRIEGPAVQGLQSAFTENWLEATGEVLRGEAYFPVQAERGTVAMQPMKSSPFSGSQTLHLALLLALSAAEQHIRIGVAYFVPSETALQQILDARRRGVEVELILPGIWTDTEEVRRASRHFWGELLQAGVKIYEYEPTMYHVKIVIVDDDWASLGSANFDERSFRLNDEINIHVFDRDFAGEQIRNFEEDKARARPVTLAAWKRRPLNIKLSDWFWSLFRSQF
jgi:cardiolipin synthase